MAPDVIPGSKHVSTQVARTVRLFTFIKRMEDEIPAEITKKKSNTKKDVGFTIIGDVKPVKPVPVDVSIPEWIRNPTTFDADTSNVSPLDELGDMISQHTKTVLKSQGITGLFPVQRTMIPFLANSITTCIRPRDVCVSAPTGSGKTLAYAIPLIDYLKVKLQSKVRALVIVPIGQLASQIKKVFDVYTKGTTVKTLVSTGKTSIDKDNESLSRHPFDIVITTPGRLEDLIVKYDSLDLTNLEIVILDEADRLCNNDVDKSWLLQLDRAIYKNPNRNCNISCPCLVEGQSRHSLSFVTSCASISFNSKVKPVHKWLFSATLSSDPVQLENMNLFHPKLFLAKHKEKATNSTPSSLREQVVQVDETKKPLLLWYLLEVKKYRRILCFTGSLENTHRLTLLLKRIPGVTSAEFSSQNPSKLRDRLLKRFANGEIDILVSSDLMARGLDVDNISHVLSYDMPSNHTAYVHRSGRTARAGKIGTTITFVTPRQYKSFKAIIKRVHGVIGQDIHTLVEHIVVDDVQLDRLMKTYEKALSEVECDIKKEFSRVKRIKGQAKKLS